MICIIYFLLALSLFIFCLPFLLALFVLVGGLLLVMVATFVEYFFKFYKKLKDIKKWF